MLTVNNVFWKLIKYDYPLGVFFFFFLWMKSGFNLRRNADNFPEM